MRRILFVAMLLAAPALGAAQSAGAMTFTNTDADPKASSINVVECRSTTATVEISWQPTASPTATPVTYQLYASNKDTSNTTVFTGLTATTVVTTCPTEADTNATNGTTVVPVGNQLTNPGSLASVPFPTAQIAQALKTTSLTDPCSGTATTTIYLCMQGKQNGTVFGTARATITLSLARPDQTPQLLLPVAPGNTALTPRWADTASNSSYYQVQLVSLVDPSVLPTAGAFDPAGTFAAFDPRDPSPRHASGFVTGHETRVSGLVNGVTYGVMITSYTSDYNPGDPSNIATASPEVTFDFWQTYKNAGGRETGGCSSGLAGPVALLALAGVLAVFRRRK
jgi:hypothetical protein